MTDRRRAINLSLFGLASLGLILGLAVHLALWAGWTGKAFWLEKTEWAAWLILAGVVPVLAAIVIDSVASLIRREVGLDLIALISIGGAIALNEYVVAGVIGVMLSGGRALEDFAEAHARREMTFLLDRVPRSANRFDGANLVSVPLESVAAGDRLLVRAGETVPVDGVLSLGSAVLDEAALTGESLPVTRQRGERLRSGAVNAGGPFEMRASAPAADSTFAGIVRMVSAAQQTKAPSVRLADQAAFVFTPLAIAGAGIAWAFSGDPIRGLAVMVVATPCPLILGVPVAVVSGLSACAGRGVLIKGGGVLERLARVRTLFLDKTGTLTAGRARLLSVETVGDASSDDVMRLAASVDQLSKHVIASAVVQAARAQGLDLTMPVDVEEEPGAGVTGTIDGRRVSVGSHAYVAARAASTGWSDPLLRRIGYDSAAGVFVSVDSAMIGALLFADEIRPDSARALRLLRRAGIERLVMLTGDRRDIGQAIGAALGLDDVRAELNPSDKLAAITDARSHGVCGMVGDGVNDAPALAAADVGIAMGAQGGGASTQAADVVILVDRLDRLAEALAIARGTRRIAMQTVVGGMVLSGVAMVVAGFGLLPPVAGAVLQEVIDVAAILNALRVLRIRVPGRPKSPMAAADVARLRAEHDNLTGLLSRVRTVADQLTILPPDQAATALVDIETLVRERLLQHELEDDTQLYPMIERHLGGDDPIGSMHRAHREVQQLGGTLGRMVADLPPDGMDDALANDFRRVLYGLDAILRLHFAQEDELYHGLSDADDRRHVASNDSRSL
jgi:heavy metal translocating P-type ATPase